ncbi:hypothetical protein Halar_2457 [halophilic archaeon DL31]|jgi:hypothetical protein|nr:hypothetical protein Halar_2457 [halophilic archaeon DL31]
MCTGSPWVVLEAVTPLTHVFYAAKNSKIDAMAEAHRLARAQQRQHGGEITYGQTAHEIPPNKTVRECEYVAVGSEAMWVVVQP